MADVLTPEHNRRLAMAEARNRDQTSANNQTSQGPRPAAGEKQIFFGQWLFMFMAAGFFWLLGLVLDLVIPLITAVMNYLIVFAIWIWAKTHNLKPPTFGSVTKVAAGAGDGAMGAAARVPGSDLVYILLGGVTPLIYLAALWWNNR